ncbi:hypothetical protein QUU78_22530, partial [Xanthomonas citri pv. citri]
VIVAYLFNCRLVLRLLSPRSLAVSAVTTRRRHKRAVLAKDERRATPRFAFRARRRCLKVLAKSDALLELAPVSTGHSELALEA